MLQFQERALLDGGLVIGVSCGVVLDPSSSASDATFSSAARSTVLMFLLAFLFKRQQGIDVFIVGAGGCGTSGMSSSLSSSLSSSKVTSGTCVRGVGLTGAFPLSFLVNVCLVAVAALAGGLGVDAGA
ncbi:hypothetical protein V6N13_056932 [Hibiscus sabdariffa]